MPKPNANRLPEHLRHQDGRYILDFMVTLENGRRCRRIEKLPQGTSKGRAMEIWSLRSREIENRHYFPQKVTFTQAADGFLEYSKSRKRSWRSDVQMVNVMKEAFGGKELAGFTVDMVERFLNKIRAVGNRGAPWTGEGAKGKLPPLMPATLNRYLACLKTIINRALTNNLLDRNPIRGIKMFRAENARDRTLLPEEYEALLAACSDHLRPMVILGYMTGMRRGEILNLRWDQVDLRQGVIRLLPDDTKTGKAREVPLDDQLADIFKAQARSFDSPRVFHYQGKPISQTKTAFKAACARAGIKDFRFHDLRHCAVTNLRKAGVATSTIMSISGHKTDAMLRRYDKVDSQDRRAALARVRNLYETFHPKEVQGSTI